jgi:hypothetical protein
MDDARRSDALTLEFSRTKSLAMGLLVVVLLPAVTFFAMTYLGSRGEDDLSWLVGPATLVAFAFGVLLVIDYLLVGTVGGRLVADRAGLRLDLPLRTPLLIPWASVERIAGAFSSREGLGWRGWNHVVEAPADGADLPAGGMRVAPGPPALLIRLRPAWRADGGRAPRSILLLGSPRDGIRLNTIVLSGSAVQTIASLERRRRSAVALHDGPSAPTGPELAAEA